MSAYVIFIRTQTRVSAELELYAQKALASLAGHSVEIRALYGHHEVIEGAEIEGAAILEFPSFAEARQWYDGAFYHEAREHRLRGADCMGIIVEGFSRTS